MNRTTKSILLSALVLPGAGHLYLRSYTRGIILLAICAAALTDFIRRAWHEAELIRARLIDEVNAGGMFDLDALIAHATAAANSIDKKPFTLAGIVLIACWLFGIFDSYRLSKRLEETATSP